MIKSLIVLFMVTVFAGAVHAAQVTPVLRCLPPATSTLFGFQISSLKQCVNSPEGPICNNNVAFTALRFDPQTQTWQATQFVDMAAFFQVNKQKQTFEFHQVGSKNFAGEHCDVSVHGRHTVINLDLGTGDQYGMLNTHGTVTNYSCDFL